MPLCIAQSGDLDRCYRCLTHGRTDFERWCYSAPYKYKSRALVTQLHIFSIEVLLKTALCPSSPLFFPPFHVSSPHAPIWECRTSEGGQVVQWIRNAVTLVPLKSFSKSHLPSPSPSQYPPDWDSARHRKHGESDFDIFILWLKCHSGNISHAII